MPSAPSDTPPIVQVRDDDATYAPLLRRRRNLSAAIAGLFLVLVVVTGVLDAATRLHEDRTVTVGPSPRLVVRDGV